MSGLLSLPDEVLKLVLIHVPLKDRLCSCCLVHTRLHAAAVAATRQLVLRSWYRPPPQRAQSLLSWLSHHGQHVTRLDMNSEHVPQPLVQLPLPNLLELSLRDRSMRIQLGPTADGRPGVAEGITKLTCLVLFDATVLDGPVVHSLSKLVHLRHLDWLCGGADSVTLSDATLPRLQHLTYLRACLSCDNILQLGALTSLQGLALDFNSRFSFSPGTGAGMVLPSSLTELVLSNQSLGNGPTDNGVQQALIALAPKGLRALYVEWRSVQGAAPPPFSCLARLQCLTRLELCARGAVAWPPAGPAYSALTASSSLVSLQVAGSLPAGLWPFVFPATHLLPRLTCLEFDDEWNDCPALWAFRAADVAALVSCCPALRDIKYLVLQPGAHVSELCKLTALTSLFADFAGGTGENSDPAGTVQGLAAVTQLVTLDACLYTRAMLPLTSLRALTPFCTCDSEEEVAYHTEAGSPPDVWLQLLEHCAAADPGCQPAALRSLAQQLSAQAQQIAGLQAQLSDKQQAAAEQDARIAGLQAQLAAQQQHNQELQQQHAAAQQVAAEQAAKIAVLEGQLQQVVAQQQDAAAQGARVAALEGQLQQLLLQHLQ